MCAWTYKSTYEKRLDHPRKCTARRHSDKEPCGAFAVAGSNVCRVHGGMAPQVRAKAKARLNNLEDQAMMRAILRRRRGDYTARPDLPEVVDTPATVDPAETASHSPADGPVEPPTPTAPEPVSASPETPPRAVPPGTGLMSMEEAVSRTRPNQAFATGRIPAARRGRRR